MKNAANATNDEDLAIRRLLENRYGDGGVYVPRAGPGRDAFEAARRRGLVSNDGFLTREGRQHLARTRIHVPPWVS